MATAMIERELLEQVAERLELWFQGHGLAADKTLVKALRGAPSVTAASMSFDDWLASDEGARVFGVQLRSELVEAARRGYEAAMKFSAASRQTEQVALWGLSGHGYSPVFLEQTHPPEPLTVDEALAKGWRRFYSSPQQPAEPVQEPVAKPTPEMLATFKAAFKGGSIRNDRLTYALSEVFRTTPLYTARPPQQQAEPVAVAAKHYFSRPFCGTRYRLYYTGTFLGSTPVFQVSGYELSRPDGTEIEEPARLQWPLPDVLAQAEPVRAEDAISRSKRLLKMVDTYCARPDRMNRTALLVALMSEFEDARSSCEDLGYVALSADGRSVFIDGIGLVPLAHQADAERLALLLRAAGRVLQAFDDGHLQPDPETLQGGIAVDALREAWGAFAPARIRGPNAKGDGDG